MSEVPRPPFNFVYNVLPEKKSISGVSLSLSITINVIIVKQTKPIDKTIM